MSDALVTGPSERERERGGVEGGEKKKKAAKGWRGERVVNKHIFMYGFRLQNALPPQV